MNFSRNILIATFAFAILVTYQNCSLRGEGPEGLFSATSAKGNGGGYDGKLSYVHVSSQGSCADGSKIVSRVELESGVARQTRKDCEDIAPRPLIAGEFVVPLHNPGFGVSGLDLYQPEGSFITGTEIYCRGRKNRNDDSGEDHVDLWIDRGENGQYIGKIAIGRYSPAGDLNQVLQSEGFRVMKNEVFKDTMGEVHYLAPDIGENRSYLLRVIVEGLIGYFASLIQNSAPAGSEPAVPAPPTLPPPVLPPLQPMVLGEPPPLPQGVDLVRTPSRDLADMIQVDQMQCAAHERAF